MKYKSYNDLICYISKKIKNEEPSKILDTVFQLNSYGSQYINNLMEKEIVLIGDKYEKICTMVAKEIIKRNLNDILLICLEQQRFRESIDKKDQLVELSKCSILSENVDALEIIHSSELLDNKLEICSKYWMRSKTIESPLIYSIKNNATKSIEYILSKCNCALYEYDNLALKELIFGDLIDIVVTNINTKGQCKIRLTKLIEILNGGNISEINKFHLINTYNENDLKEYLDMYGETDLSITNIINKIILRRELSKALDINKNKTFSGKI